MGSTAYEKNRNAINKYMGKCERIQLFLNPDNADDKLIIDYLSKQEGAGATKVKQALLRYVKMENALKGI